MVKYTEGESTSSRGQWCLNPARLSQVVSGRVESEPAMAGHRAMLSRLQT